MMITDKALAAGAITQEQAEELEDWIDAAVAAGRSVTVPQRFTELMNICAAYNMEPEGGVQ